MDQRSPRVVVVIPNWNGLAHQGDLASVLA
jgi:hypothetical protein